MKSQLFVVLIWTFQFCCQTFASDLYFGNAGITSDRMNLLTISVSSKGDCAILCQKEALCDGFHIHDAPGASSEVVCSLKHGKTSFWQRYTRSEPGIYYESEYNYGEVLEKSILFYEAQRSGKLPANNRIPWRKDSALDDGSDVGLDLSGGWYDGTGYMKFSFTMAFSVTAIAWGVDEFLSAYESTNQLNYVLESLKWPLDYLMKCLVGNKFYAKVGDKGDDYWGRPEDMTMARPYKIISPSSPGSDILGEVAAAMAASSVIFRNHDSAYARQLVTCAIDLYNLASTHLGKYSDYMEGDGYKSVSYKDELAWGAVWLYYATGEQQYMDKAVANYQRGGAFFGWNTKKAGVQLMMYKLTNETRYADDLKKFITSFMPGGSTTYTPGGLAFKMTGALKFVASVAFIAVTADKYGIMPGEARAWAKTQIDYILGTNPQARSYVVGFGRNPPQRINHKSSSCPGAPEPCGPEYQTSPDPNPHVLYGALVSGPDDQDSFVDMRSAATTVGCEFNAGFQSAIAGLIWKP